MLAHMLLVLLFHFGQPVRLWAQELRFKHIGINDGLPQSSVYCMYQDAKGFIWVGTTNGLSRYDGYAFRHFKFSQGNPHSINSNEMLSMAEDSLGNLLVGTPNGLNIYDPKTERFKEAPLVAGDGSEPYRFVKIIIRTRNNIVWTGSSKGLLRFNTAKQVLEKISIPGTNPGSVTALFEAADGTLWLGIGRALVRWNPASNKISPLPQALLNNPAYNKSAINRIIQDKAGNTWIATERNGLMVLDASQQQVLNFESSGSEGRVMNDVVRDVVLKSPDVWGYKERRLRDRARFENKIQPPYRSVRPLLPCRQFGILFYERQSGRYLGGHFFRWDQHLPARQQQLQLHCRTTE